jgi:bud site selection protein 20
MKCCFSQIDTDLKVKPDEMLNQEVDLDQAGFAQFYCIHCAKYYINQRALDDHFKTKVHKRRMKALEDEPYTEKEAELAAGHGSFTYKPPKRKMETQPSKEEMAKGKRLKIEEFTKEEFESLKKSEKAKEKSQKKEKMQE